MLPNGIIRLGTPDLEKLLLTYRDRNPEVSLKEVVERHRTNHNRRCHTKAEYLNDMFRLWGHSFIYDFETLSAVLTEVGFVNITRVSFGESHEDDLRGLERHADRSWMRDGVNLFIEARKPGA